MEKMKSRRHSLLYLPGDNTKFITKSVTTKCDAIIMDLEDAVSTDHKSLARETTAAAVSRFHEMGVDKELMVRINSFSTTLAYQDLLAIVPYGLDAVIVPKADKESICVADNLLAALENEHKLPRISIIGLIETAAGLVQAEDTIKASTRLDGLQFGAEDYTRDLEIMRTNQGNEVSFAKQYMAVMCHAYGIDAIDTPYTDIHDEEGLKYEIETAKQMDVINTAFLPSASDISYAERLIQAFDKAVAMGRGSITFEGKMIDLPIYQRAKRLVSRVENYK